MEGEDNLFDKFVVYLAGRGILKTHLGDTERLAAIYQEIEDSDIKMATGTIDSSQKSDAYDRGGDFAEMERASELRIVFALADFLKMQAQDSENVIFDTA
jgi:hypothetical protein